MSFVVFAIERCSTVVIIRALNKIAVKYIRKCIARAVSSRDFENAYSRVLLCHTCLVVDRLESFLLGFRKVEIDPVVVRCCCAMLRLDVTLQIILPHYTWADRTLERMISAWLIACEGS